MEFTFVSGDLALDFAGTLRHRFHDRHDQLAAPADAARWTVAAGLLTREPDCDHDGLAAAVALREAVYRAATAARAGHALGPADTAALNAAAAHAPTVPALRPGTGVRRTGTLHAALSDIARAAVTLLGGPRAADIRECQAPTCTRLYLDASRRRTRRWCDMARCGNRAKAAAYRTRHTP
ncbi:CGNR zinc finger domain-containing protein [Spirillospora sp. CA-294931]|uniref:CGNR zinc finger domain-containing protein n=1 Tax=Spirillospora sp. CA-294931 TaxID=3240042 RepID=UPI003D89D3C1